MRISPSGTCIGFALAAFFATIPLSAQELGQLGPSDTEIARGIHLLPGLYANVLALTSAQGVLLIDSGSDREADTVAALVAGLDAGHVRLAVNTHFHFDHIGGNAALAADGAIIVAQENARKRMLSEWRFPDSLEFRMPLIQPYPEVALPTMTFEETLKLYFGGEEIVLLHFPAAHSDADLAVLLRNANVIHTGDLFASGGFVPPMDAYHGGTIDGWIVAVDELIELTDDRTKVVPGHGPITDRQSLKDFRDVLVAGRGRIAALVSEGKSLEEVLEANPMDDLVGRRNSGFVRTVYAQLAWREGT
jgi:glyoxylase-like metal-dependent hydrolase (beta-lactamase superfamily II)